MMGYKLLVSLICVVSFLVTTSFCHEESLIREVTDVQVPLVLKTTATRVTPPASYLMKIKSFSLMADAYETNRYESAVFEASGYNWTLVLYPNGKKDESGNGYISLYLAIQGFNSLPKNWEVYADVKVFVYNQAKDNYLTFQDGSLKRFNAGNTELGYPQVLSLAAFKDSKNGYLVNDDCAFGTEVYVPKRTKNWEEFDSIKPKQDEAKFTWKIKNFSKLDKEFYLSPKFNAGGISWNMYLYPKGNRQERGKWMSLFFMAYGYDDGTPRNVSFYTNYKLRVLNQRLTEPAEKEFKIKYGPSYYGTGDARFITLTDLLDKSKGFIVDDTVIVQSEVFKVSKTKYFP